MTPQVWQSVRQRPHRKWSKLECEVLAAVEELGDAHPRGLGDRFGKNSVTNAWGGKSQHTRQVLEKLHHHGYLRVCRRENGIRVYVSRYLSGVTGPNVSVCEEMGSVDEAW